MMRCSSGLGFGVLVLFVSMALAGYSQCIPDTDVQGMYAPTAAEGLPEATVGEQYEAVISLKVPSDTHYLSYNFSVDSMVLTGIQGLPNGYSYLCTPPSCGFPGGDYGCILLTGFTDDNALAGDYDLVAQFEFYFSFGSLHYVQPYAINDYTLTLNPSATTAVADVASDEPSFFIEPNPVVGNSKLRFTLPGDGLYDMTIFSLLGAEVGRVQAFGKRGTPNSLRLAEFDLQPGVYFLSLKQGGYTRSLRFVVQ